jgi:hypothetical protein
MTTNGQNRTLKLHQILAVDNSTRTQIQKDLTELYHLLQKTQLLSGLSRTYEPTKENGEQLTPEETLLQVRTPDIIRKTSDILVNLYDTVSTRDFANCDAKADVILEDGSILIKDAPATFLLWLEKKLDDVHTLVSNLPVLPADTEWVFDEAQNCYKNKNAVKTAKTEKVFYPLVLFEGNDKHPPQVSEKSREEVIGYWTTIKYSGSLEAKEVAKIKNRVEKLQKAVKFAREKANSVDAPKIEVGKKIMDYIFREYLQV